MAFRVRYPIVFQHDANDCGPACLAMVSAWYGHRQSLADLRERAATDRQGTSLAGLVRAAIEMGFRTRAVRAQPAALPTLKLPAIAHWVEDGRSHFVVVYRYGKRSVTVGDPALGRRRLSRDAFETCWTRALLVLEPTPDLRSLASAPREALWSLIRPHRMLFLEALGASLAATVLGLSSAFFIRILVDVVIPSERTATLNWLGLGMMLVFVFRSTLAAFRGYLLARLSQRIDADVVLGYHDHVLGLPLAFFATRRTGEIVARFQDAVRIRAALGTAGLSIVVDTVTLVVTVSVMLGFDWKLALVGLSLTPLLAAGIAALTPGLRRAQERAMERSAQFQAHAIEAVESIETLRTARAESGMRLRGEIRLKEVLEARFRSEVYGLWGAGLAGFLAGASGLALLWVGGHGVLAGRITTGQLMALYSMLGMVLGPVERLASANHVVQDALVAGARVGEILSLPPEPDRPRTPGSAIAGRRFGGHVEICGLRFGFGQHPALFDGLTLEFFEGECCRIAGASGSGKSTLVRLLVRLYEPQAGRIRIDGTDIRDYRLDDLRSHVVLLSQESRVLSASIGDNIRLGRTDATPEAIRDAARRAGAAEFVERSPHGYDTLVGERGISLSGGERQRLVLARAILGDPDILILDEPTNHLDRSSVEAVRAVIEARRRQRQTTLVISHDALPADRTVSIMRNCAVKGATFKH